jgi:hypothetical protein
MVRIRRFNVVKTSTVVALMYMVISAIFVIPFFVLFAIIGVSFVPGAAARGSLAIGGLVGAVVVVLLYGVLAWVFTAIACAIYNLVAGWVGGIEVEVDRPDPPAPPPAWMVTGPPPAPPISGPSSSPGV